MYPLEENYHPLSLTLKSALYNVTGKNDWMVRIDGESVQCWRLEKTDGVWCWKYYDERKSFKCTFDIMKPQEAYEVFKEKIKEEFTNWSKWKEHKKQEG